MPRNVVEKMKFLCYKIPNNEWSGILLYKIIGNFSTGKFRVLVKDLFPMNVGSATYTEYEFDAAFIKYRMANPESLDWDVAHCHSHQSFSTFFSGTDTAELKDNVENHNYYLSLIVNNAMETSCKIAFKGKQKIQQNSIMSFNGYDGKLSTIRSNKAVEEEVMFTYKCEVELEQSFKVGTSFSGRVHEIIDNKIAADKVAEEARIALAAKNKSTLPVTKHYALQTGNVSEYNEDKWWEERESYMSGSEYGTKSSFNKPANTLEDDELEDMVADCLCLKYECKKDVEEALFSANKDYIERGEKYIAEVGIFFRNMYPAYTGDDEPTEEVLTSILETLYYHGEDDFSELVELLAVEFINEAVVV